MPSGKVHDSIALLSIIPVTLVGEAVFHASIIRVLTFTVSAIFCQLMFGPDLDAKSTHYRRWGIFRWIWIPYRKFFKHRSRFSHGLLLGPVIRCIYFILSAIVVIIVLNCMIVKLLSINLLIMLLPLVKVIVQNTNLHILISIIIPIIFGMFTGAAIHTLTDKFVSFFKNLI